VPVSAPNVGVAPVPPPSGAPPGTPVDGIKKTADNKYDVKKDVLDKTLSNLNSVATQARIVPSFKNGVANGFKVFSIQPNSFYSSIGVENGDVIQKINGYEINSPDKALEIYQKLREARHVTVDLERNGQTIRKEYNVTGQ
jgi:general secretion pathway protein C